MNNDLISRNELEKHKFLTPQVKVVGGRRCGKVREQITEAYQKGWNDCIDAIIDNAPAVENITVFTESADEKATAELKEELQKVLEERPQGEWIIVKDEKWGDNVKCPFCGKELAGTDLNFCCKCGADMRKGGAE